MADKPILADPDAPRRVVGRRRAPADPLKVEPGARDDARRWRLELGSPFVRRGVYRFATHAEADESLWQMITRPRS